ncbi:MAG: MFS transporter [Treponema sp.]|jgi:MFS family permease|nr:MFS transporter [Treponema sp.]
MNHDSNPPKIWNLTFISIFIANMLLYLGQAMSNSILPLYADSLNAPSAVIGIVASSYAITALVFKLISAPAIDTFNRKYILAAAFFFMAVAFIGFSFSKTMPALIFFRLLQGTGQAFTATCCLALASDTLPREKLGAGIGYFSLAQAIMQAFGPTVGLKLKDMIGFSMTFVTGASAMALAVLFALSLKISFTKTKKFYFSLNSIIAKEAIIPAILLFFLATSFMTITSFVAIFGKETVGSNIGYFFTVYALTMLVTRPLVGKLADKFGYVKVMLPMMILFALSLIIISFSSSLPQFMVAAFLNAFGYGGCGPAIQSLCMKRVPKERRGAGSCTSYIGMDLGSLLGPVIAGTVAGKLGYVSMWRIMIIPILTAVFLVFLFRQDIDSAAENPVKE